MCATVQEIMNENHLWNDVMTKGNTTCPQPFHGRGIKRISWTKSWMSNAMGVNIDFFPQLSRVDIHCGSAQSTSVGLVRNSLPYWYVSRYLFHDMIHEMVLTFHFFITKHCLLEQNNIHLLSPCSPAAIFKHYSVRLDLQKTNRSDWL
jgi:hypothetical protein